MRKISKNLLEFSEIVDDCDYLIKQNLAINSDEPWVDFPWKKGNLEIAEEKLLYFKEKWTKGMLPKYYIPFIEIINEKLCKVQESQIEINVAYDELMRG